MKFSCIVSAEDVRNVVEDFEDKPISEEKLDSLLQFMITQGDTAMARYVMEQYEDWMAYEANKEK